MKSHFSLGFTANRYNLTLSELRTNVFESKIHIHTIIKFYLQNDILEMSINVAFFMGKRSPITYEWNRNLESNN